MLRPSGAVTTPSRVRSTDGSTSHSAAAVDTICCFAAAAAVRIGMYVEIVVLDPPVNWFICSSGRASASVTWTLLTGTSSSSAISIAVDVVMPWPVSMRGNAKDAVPSL
jgi:hypothetical protein